MLFWLAVIWWPSTAATTASQWIPTQLTPHETSPPQSSPPVIITRYELRECMANNKNNNFTFPASVPGSITLDYATHIGIDPYVDDNELGLSWISLQHEWTYVAHGLPDIITKHPCLHSECVCHMYFESIDTIAIIIANGMTIGTTDNAYLPVIVDVPCNLQSLRIVITSSLIKARSMPRAREYPHTINYNTWTEASHRNMIRKPGADFGWDWGPAFPGPGIRGNVYYYKGMEGAVYLDYLTIAQSFHGPDITQPIRAMLTVNIAFHVLTRHHHHPSIQQQWSVNFQLQYQGETIGDVVNMHISHDFTTSALLVIPSPQMWWPINTMNNASPLPHLYDLIITVLYQKQPTQTIRRRIGLRNVELQQWHSLHVPNFSFIINGRPVFLQGTNYVPPDAFVRSIDVQETTIRRLVMSAIALGSNVIRVWGGGPIPPEDFYSLCDEMGILVWQDLPYACAVYPPNRPDAEAETLSIVRRLQHHASIILWGGNNEVEASFTWFPQVIRNISRYRQDYVELFLHMIERAVRIADPWHRPFLDSSPSNGRQSPLNSHKVWGDVSDPTRGDVHFYSYDTDCENPDSYPANALFVSEHGFPSMPLILPTFVTGGSWQETDWTGPVHVELTRRLRHADGFQQMRQAISRRFDGINFTGMTYHTEALVTQMIQARCMNAAIDVWRSSQFNHGVILWQLNDNWPGISWSMMEWDGSWKSSAYVLRRKFVRVTVSARWATSSSGGGIEIYVQDTGRGLKDDFMGEVDVYFFQWQDDKNIPHPIRLLFRIAGDDDNARETLIGTLAAPVNNNVCICVKGSWTNVNGNVVVIPPSYLDAPGYNNKVNSRTLVRNPVEWSVKDCVVTITAVRGAAFHVWLDVVDLSWRRRGYFDDNFFHLLMGETRTVTFLVDDGGTFCVGMKVSVVTVNDLNVWGNM